MAYVPFRKNAHKTPIGDGTQAVPYGKDLNNDSFWGCLVRFETPPFLSIYGLCPFDIFAFGKIDIGVRLRYVTLR